MASNYCESCGMRDTELSHHDQCPVGEAQARVLALASAMVECPQCKGRGEWTPPPMRAIKMCDQCGGEGFSQLGSGSVPRFQELRDYYSSQCGKPGCSCAMDWNPLPVAEAAGKIRQMQGFQDWLEDQAGIYLSKDAPPLLMYRGSKDSVWLIETLCDDDAVIAAAYAWAGLE